MTSTYWIVAGVSIAFILGGLLWKRGNDSQKDAFEVALQVEEVAKYITGEQCNAAVFAACLHELKAKKKQIRVLVSHGTSYYSIALVPTPRC